MTSGHVVCTSDGEIYEGLSEADAVALMDEHGPEVTYSTVKDTGCDRMLCVECNWPLEPCRKEAL